uniref:Uncharacterized protein n=1 Tax=Oryza nivara TaxID=4536 RepID=A0A0E0FR37_ORYNI
MWQLVQGACMVNGVFEARWGDTGGHLLLTLHAAAAGIDNDDEDGGGAAAFAAMAGSLGASVRARPPPPPVPPQPRPYPRHLPLHATTAGTDDDEEDGGGAAAFAVMAGSLGGSARARALHLPSLPNHVRIGAVCCSTPPPPAPTRRRRMALSADLLGLVFLHLPSLPDHIRLRASYLAVNNIAGSYKTFVISDTRAEARSDDDDERLPSGNGTSDGLSVSRLLLSLASSSTEKRAGSQAAFLQRRPLSSEPPPPPLGELALTYQDDGCGSRVDGEHQIKRGRVWGCEAGLQEASPTSGR